MVDEKIPNFEEIAKQKVAASFRVRGKVVKSPAEGQPVELLCDDPENHSVEILGSNQDTARYPLAKKAHSIEHLRSSQKRYLFRDPPFLPEQRVPLHPHADHHGKRLRGSRRNVPGHYFAGRRAKVSYSGLV